MRKHSNENYLTVYVKDGDLENAMRVWKNHLSRSNIWKILKLKRAYEKPSATRRRKMREAIKRMRIMQAKRNRYRNRRR